jgi:hypothetical protein
LRERAARQGKATTIVFSKSGRGVALAAKPQHLTFDPKSQVLSCDRGHNEPKILRGSGFAASTGTVSGSS